MLNRLFTCMLVLVANAQPPPRPSLPASESSRSAAIDHWRALRFGLFVHWGVATGRALPQSHSHARLSQLNPSGSVPAEVYDQYYRDFNPIQYDPDALLKLAHEAGMRYAVFVSKHHDGFSMYRSATNPYNVMATPYGQDVAGIFADACRRQGLALGWQISPKDWKNPDFNTERQDRYNAYYESIIHELATQYGPLVTMWFDGTEPITAAQWKGTPQRIFDYLHQVQPGIVLGNHSGGPEDFVSFEDMVGPFDRKLPWEMAEQINPSGWVFNKPMPTRPFRELLRNLVYSVSRDGNYLLDVGPMQDGRFYAPDAERLGDFAKWMSVNAEGIQGTRGGPYRDGDWGAATCKGNVVYLFMSDRVGAELTLPLLGAKVQSASRLDGGTLRFKAGPEGLRFSMPDRQSVARPVFLGIKLQLDREAFGLPTVEGQENLAATAQIVPSSVRKGFPVSALFDNLGETAWDPDGSELNSALDFDLGKDRSIGSMSFAQRTQNPGWQHYFHYQIKVRHLKEQPWTTVHSGFSCLGGIPVLEFAAVQARYVRLEITKSSPSHTVQLAELRLFASLPGSQASLPGPSTTLDSR